MFVGPVRLKSKVKVLEILPVRRYAAENKPPNTDKLAEKISCLPHEAGSAQVLLLIWTTLAYRFTCLPERLVHCCSQLYTSDRLPVSAFPS
jgi:hypothetical protein